MVEPTPEQLSKLKKLETDILREFAAVCEKLNLKYYLLGGTLLGAVRHKGFIPWDDDIDVGMPREDYEIFLKRAAEYLPSNLFVQSMESDPGYVNCFAKIRNSDTTFMESSSAKMNIHHGVFIDIFPLDYYPENALRQWITDTRKKWYARRVGCEFSLPEDVLWVRKIKRFILQVMFPSLNAVLSKRERMYRSVPQSGLIANYGGAWGKREIVPAEWYGEGVTVEFEGMQVMAPAEYDKWLTQVYGDYMQLPPVEKRVGHHYVDVIDLEKPYTEYVGRKE